MYAAQGKAFRVWDGERKVKVGVVARSLHELKSKGRQHLNLPEEEDLSIVLEEDGTVVADNEFFQFIPDQTVVQLLTEGQEWRPEAPDDVTQTDGTDEADTAGPIVDLSTDNEVKQLCRKLRQDIAAIVSFTPFQLELEVMVRMRRTPQCQSSPRKGPRVTTLHSWWSRSEQRPGEDNTNTNDRRPPERRPPPKTFDTSKQTYLLMY
uniref:CIDE-N domain-containing protein n=1 Tax=Branchiostoma floridae TaxID=7739 RepID=C3ZIK3_BRAFL|eukprot:XP_002591717.1 hypothetical protein BRAFLDRAFT_80812 [Branchiostoma floridae]